MKRRVIVNFHGLGVPERPTERGEAPYWVAPELLAETLILAERFKNTVETWLTFDDGNASDLAIAADLLARHGRKARFFVLAGRLGQPGSLSPEDLRELVAAGHHVETHGFDHVDWTKLDEAGQHREWHDAREVISEALGAPVSEAGIPFGSYDRKVISGLRRAGYRQVYSSDGGRCGPESFLLPRTSARADMDSRAIEAILLGREGLRRRLRRRLAMAVKKRL